MDTNIIHTGDCFDVLPTLPDESVHMVMTSPPYWNLRDYDHADQLGLEPESDQYVQNMADVFDEVKRVLRPDGSLWLNLGDTYENKDLQQIPARVALELQQRGWILRNRVTWAKPNPMPQSVKDRLNDTTEAVFHFVKNKSYWYDLNAVREPHSDAGIRRRNYSETPRGEYIEGKGGSKFAQNDLQENPLHPAGKNPGDVFEVTTKPFPDAHFAVYPPELCEKPLKATCPPKVCAECGSPYERDVEREREYVNNSSPAESGVSDMRNDVSGEDHDIRRGVRTHTATKGWNPTCDCDTDATEPGIAIDTFAGAGTTLLKAKELGRQFVGVELNPKYADMARARIGLDVDDPSNVRDDADHSGLEAYKVSQ